MFGVYERLSRRGAERRGLLVAANGESSEGWPLEAMIAGKPIGRAPSAGHQRRRWLVAADRIGSEI